MAIIECRASQAEPNMSCLAEITVIAAALPDLE